MWHVRRSLVALVLIALFCFAFTFFPCKIIIQWGDPDLLLQMQTTTLIVTSTPTTPTTTPTTTPATTPATTTTTPTTTSKPWTTALVTTLPKGNASEQSCTCSCCAKVPIIYFVTATYKRQEQLAELIRLAQTLMHIPSLVWIVAEDANGRSKPVADLLKRYNLTTVHLHAPMPQSEVKKKQKARGVSNRNKGLEWIRKSHKSGTEGVVYFGDDDNTYDLRLFEEIRSVKKVGMWPVGLMTSFGMSSPIVKNGVVKGFYDGWVVNRKFPVDMAGFAVNVKLILKMKDLKMQFIAGYEEDRFLNGLKIRLEDIEPKADNCTKILVWHTQTKRPLSPKPVNQTAFGNTNIWTLYKLIS